MGRPFYPMEDEIITYLMIPVLTIGQKYFTSKSYEYNIDFGVFIIIQASIVFLTFLIDVVLFDKVFTAWNAIGGVIVILAACTSVLMY